MASSDTSATEFAINSPSSSDRGTASPGAAAALSIEASAEWIAYATAPSGAALAALVTKTSIADRALLIAAVERLFFERNDWKIAQHAAMLHLDRFKPHTEQTDLVKALCFADHACLLSKDDPRARLMMGAVSWERRLPLAILHDVEVIRSGEARLRGETSENVVRNVLGEAFLLEGLARAYLEDVQAAHANLIQAECHGCLTLEAVIQLLIAAEPKFPEVSAWAASLVPPHVVLGSGAERDRNNAQRRKFLWLLRARESHG